MAMEKTLYWMAVGVMALFLGNHFANKYNGSCLAHRTIATMQRSGEAIQFDGNEGLADSEAAMARAQVQPARQQAACARVQAQRARMMALEQLQRMRVVFPRQRVSVEVPQSPAIAHDGTI
jgi:hypothetical protein